MEHESVEGIRASLRAEAESTVQKYLQEIDASKLRIYSGMENERFQQSIVRAMQAIGANITNLPDADEMLDRILTSPPDLVIIPVGYNGTENLEFVDRLGAEARTRMQPVLVITRLHTSVDFAPEDKDRYLGWAGYYVEDCYFQRRVLSFLSYVARRRRIARLESSPPNP